MTLNSHWKRIQAAIRDAAMETIEKRRSKKKEEWYDEEYRNYNMRKTEARNKVLIRNTQRNQQYKELRTAAKKLIRRKKSVYKFKNFGNTTQSLSKQL